MEFRVEIASQPIKFIKKLNEDDKRRILKKLREISCQPLQRDSKIVEGRKERTYRVRVGNYRILYHVFWDKKVILVSIIDKRARVYR